MKKYLIFALLFISAVCSAQTATDSLSLTNEDNYVVQSGRDYAGKQILYRPDGTIERERNYEVYRDSIKETRASILTEETLYYPNGSVQEKVTIHYGGPFVPPKDYERTIYYPTGEIQYHEVWKQSKYTEMYYGVDGEKTENPDTLFEHFFVMPEFPGGQQELFRYLSENVKFPSICSEIDFQGRTLVECMVGKDGVFRNIVILRSSGLSLWDKEALRVVKTMPAWNPGTIRGKPVEVRYIVPISFKIQ